MVWKFAYLTPMSAIRVIVGVSTGPPKQSIVPKPTSSQQMKRTFGAPSGAFGARYGAQSGSESRMSSAILPCECPPTSPTPSASSPYRPAP